MNVEEELMATNDALVRKLAEAREQIAAKDAALLEDKPFGIDPATHFLHADDGGAPDSCIFYVPRDELREARAQIAAKDAELAELKGQWERLLEAYSAAKARSEH